jgi:hypothetical protein
MISHTNIVTVHLDPTLEVEDARAKIFKKFSLIDIVHSQGKSPCDYVLKATGFREYLLPNLEIGNRHHLSPKSGGFKLLDYDYIRRCISKNQQIELTLVDSTEVHSQIVQGNSPPFFFTSSMDVQQSNLPPPPSSLLPPCHIDVFFPL